jgi:hypothetical protein
MCKKEYFGNFSAVPPAAQKSGQPFGYPLIQPHNNPRLKIQIPNVNRPVRSLFHL